MYLTNNRPAVIGIAMLGAVLALSAACSVAKNGTEGFWDALRIEALEAERYESLAEMSEASDGVVVGTFTSVRVGRIVQGDAPEDVIAYLTADLRIKEVLAGSVAGSSIPLEFLFPGPPDTAEEQLPELTESLPRSEIVVFLRAKQGAGESGLYRVVNSLGLWAETERSRVDTPLAELPPSESGVYSTELAGIESIQGLIEFLSAR